MEWVAIPAKAGNEGLAEVWPDVGHAVLDEPAVSPAKEVCVVYDHSAGSAAFDALSGQSRLADIGVHGGQVDFGHY